MQHQMPKLTLVLAAVFLVALGAGVGVGAALTLADCDDRPSPAPAASNDDASTDVSELRADQNDALAPNEYRIDTSAPEEQCAIQSGRSDVGVLICSPEAPKVCRAYRAAFGRQGDYWSDVDPPKLAESLVAVCSLINERTGVRMSVFDSGGMVRGQGICGRSLAAGWIDAGDE